MRKFNLKLIEVELINKLKTEMISAKVKDREEIGREEEGSARSREYSPLWRIGVVRLRETDK